MLGVSALAAACLVACRQDAPVEFVLEPRTLRAALLEAARAWCPGEPDLGGMELTGRGDWRVATTRASTPAERLALATSLVPGEWTWIASDAGAAARRRGEARARMLEQVLAAQAVDQVVRWGEARTETLARLGDASDLRLAFGADVDRALLDTGRWPAGIESLAAEASTVGAKLDLFLGEQLVRASRSGRVIIVSEARAAFLVEEEAAEADLRAKLAGSASIALGPAGTAGELLQQLAAALDVPWLVEPLSGPGPELARPVGAVVTGRVPVRACLWLLERATGRRLRVVGAALWLVAGERARVLEQGPWGDVLLEDELRRWPLALPAEARRLQDAPALIAQEGLRISLEDSFRIALSRFEVEVAPRGAATATVAAVLDRLASACGAGGWHVYRGEIRLGPPPLTRRR